MISSSNLSTSSASCVSTLGSPKHVIAVKPFFLRLVLIYLIRIWVCGRTWWEQLTDRLWRLGSQVITLKVLTVGYLMCGRLTIGTMVLQGDIWFFFWRYWNCLIYHFDAGWSIQKVKLAAVSTNDATIFLTMLGSKMFWLVWKIWPFSSARRVCRSEWYLCQNRGCGIVSCGGYEHWGRHGVGPIWLYTYPRCLCDRFYYRLGRYVRLSSRFVAGASFVSSFVLKLGFDTW